MSLPSNIMKYCNVVGAGVLLILVSIFTASITGYTENPPTILIIHVTSCYLLCIFSCINPILDCRDCTSKNEVARIVKIISSCILILLFLLDAVVAIIIIHTGQYPDVIKDWTYATCAVSLVMNIVNSVVVFIAFQEAYYQTPQSPLSEKLDDMIVSCVAKCCTCVMDCFDTL